MLTRLNLRGTLFFVSAPYVFMEDAWCAGSPCPPAHGPQICGPASAALYSKEPEAGRWVACKGSVEGSRGFTCGLWLLFHTCADRCG